jgi:ABC-type multidrug transport system fused ATPase/permease subunit
MLTALKKLSSLFCRKNKLGFIVLLCFMFLGAILETLGVGAIPAFVSVIAFPDQILKYPFLKPFLEYLDLTTPKQLLIYTGLALFVIFVIKNIYISFVYYLQERFTKNRQVDLSHRLFCLYINAPYSFHLKHDGSELIRNLNLETQRAITGILVPLQTIAMQGLVLISIFILLLFTEPVITVFAGIILGSASGFFLKALNAQLKKLGREAQKERQVSIQAINQGFSGIKEVLISGNSGYFTNRFLISIRRMTSADAFWKVTNKLSQPFLESIIVFGILAVAFLLLFMERPIESIAPILALFGAALIRLKSCMNMIVQSFTSLRYNSVALNPIWNDINKLTKPASAPGPSATPPILQNSIELDTIQYSYPEADRPAIKDITLTIPKGASVAFVGSTGSGKTTLVDTLLGLLKAEQGQIRVDGVDIFDNLTEWHQKIGYIPQFIYLLNDTIKNNIALGLEDSEIDEDKLQRAIRTAQLDAFVVSLSEGVETVVGERGIRLSGGQRQRIGIARALYNNPEVLIMDEATSSLDNTTEDLLVTALEKLKKDRTIIMIAHRLGTVKNCDKLYFLKEGHIENAGTYEELLLSCEEFRKMAG